MACKNCEALQSSGDRLRIELGVQDRLATYNAERADELQEACNRHKARATSALNEASTLWVSLRKAQAKPSVEELLSIASKSSQIAKLSGIDAPAVIEEANAVALGALKQVRARLEGGAGDGR